MSDKPIFKPSTPESETIQLKLPEADNGNGVLLTQFTEYSFHSNLLSTTEDWSFTVAGEEIKPVIREALEPGRSVTLTLNGDIQHAGIIDRVEASATRSGGLEYRITGRDRLGQAVDSCADPTLSFKESQTLVDVLSTLFKPYGWDKETSFIVDNETSKQLKAGEAYRRKSIQTNAKGFGRRALKAYKMHQYRPYPRESIFEFASRITQRFGLWIWTSADGKSLVVSSPDFESPTVYSIIRKPGDVNVLEGTVTLSGSNQPTYIVADTQGKGGEFGHGKGKVVMANPAVNYVGPGVPEIKKYLDTGAKLIENKQFKGTRIYTAVPRILYLHDDESQTPEHLEAFVRREMGLLQRQALTCHYKVEGHGQRVNEGFIPWVIDTNVNVNDEVGGLFDVPMYLVGRTFIKSRSGGTFTDLELIPQYSIVFTDTGK